MSLGSLIIVAIVAGACIIGDAEGQPCGGGTSGLITQVDGLVEQGRGCGGRTCNTNSDCQPGQSGRITRCCITNSPFRGKRGVRVEDAGVCGALGGRNDGCLVDQGPLDPTALMQLHCPCGEHFTCTGTGMFVKPQGEIGVCAREPAALEHVECNTNANCPNFHCCVSTVRPIGKRGVPQFSGTCKPLGQLGKSCLLGNLNTHPLAGDQSYYESCPCKNNLDCVGTGFMDMPLGEVGRCERRGNGGGQTPGRQRRGWGPGGPGGRGGRGGGRGGK